MRKLIVLAVPVVAGLALLGSGSRAAPPQLVRIAPAAAVQAAPAPPVIEAPAATAAPVEAPAPAPEAAAPAPAAVAIDTATTEEAPTPATEPPAPEYCPKDGSVYLAGSCTLDPSVMPSGAAEGTPVKYCSGNFECPADYPDPGDGQPLTGCTTTDYHSCESYTPQP